MNSMNIRDEPWEIPTSKSKQVCTVSVSAHVGGTVGRAPGQKKRGRSNLPAPRTNILYLPHVDKLL